MSLLESKAGVQNTTELWNAIVAKESFPPGVDSAFYFLEISKATSNAAEVRAVEAEIIRALHVLACCWSFSGGSYMALHTDHLQRAPRYESNADEVEATLLARTRLTRLESTREFAICAGATYHVPPLEGATTLAKYLVGNEPARRLLEYFHKGWIEYFALNRIERSDWFINLYKVRDALTEIHGRSEDQARTALSIPKTDWSKFGMVLNNNDLRHGSITDRAPSLPREDVSHVFSLARGWVKKELQAKGLPVV